MKVVHTDRDYKISEEDGSYMLLSPSDDGTAMATRFDSNGAEECRLVFDGPDVIGISVDGGATFRSTISSRGIVAESIKQGSNLVSYKDFGIKTIDDWEQIEQEKIYKYEQIEEMWRSKNLTTLDMMRHLAKVIDGKEPPTRKRRQ